MGTWQGIDLSVLMAGDTPVMLVFSCYISCKCAYVQEAISAQL